MARLKPSEHRRIVVAVDGTDESMHAAAVASRLVAQKGELVFVHVLEVALEFALDAQAPPEEEAARRAGQDLLCGCQAVADRYGVTSRRMLVRAHAAGPAIVDAAERCEASLVVIAGEQRFSRHGRLRLGGTSTHVLKHAACRVLVLTAGAQAAAALEQVA